MGKEYKKHTLLSASSSSGSKSRSRSRSRDKRHKKHKTKDRRDRNRDRNRKRSESSSPRHKRRFRSKGRSGSRSNSRDRRRSRDRDHRRKDDKRDRRDREREDDRRQAQEEQVEKLEEPKISPEKPNFTPSGILAKFTNSVNGVVLKFTEPPEAAVPDEKWNIYPFKGEEALPALHLHKQSCYLVGKDRKVADIPIDHPTCSSQHAVIQFREVKKAVGEMREIITEVKPYLMDLESKNGTFLNGDKIDPAKYYELLNKDIIKFAMSSREYVVMKGE